MDGIIREDVIFGANRRPATRLLRPMARELALGAAEKTPNVRTTDGSFLSGRFMNAA